MVKLNADVHPSLSEIITENLRRRNIVTIVDFISTNPIKLTNITGLLHTVRISLIKDKIKTFLKIIPRISFVFRHQELK